MEFKGNLIMKVVNEDGSFKKYEGENTFTTLLKNLLMTKGIGSLFSSFSQSLGTTRTWTGKRYLISNYYASSPYTAMRIYLLNDSSDAVSATDTFLPIFNNDGTINESMIVGYADFNYITDNNKQGCLAMPDGEAALLPNNLSVGFHWAVGKLNGTFNKIVICANPEICGTIYQSKTFDEFVPALGQSNSSGYVGLPNTLLANGTYTNDYTILVGASGSPNTARKKINLITGAITELNAGDPEYDTPLISNINACHSKYKIASSGGSKFLDLYQSSSNVYYTLTDSTGTQLYSSSIVGYGWVVNKTAGKVYILATRNSTNCVIKVYDINNNFTELTEESITIPTASLINTGAYSSIYLQQLTETEFAFVLSTWQGRNFDSVELKNLVFNDITNPMGSIIGTTNMRVGSYINFTDNNNKSRSFILMNNNEISSDGNIPRVIGPANNLVSKSNFGLEVIDMDNWFGNVLTVMTPATPISVSSTESFDLTYTFSFN